jgi:phosphatidylglycerol:prolipoprotein diacylglycerol transferase
MYITWYGFGRMLIEGLRTDSLYVGVFRISQVVGFVCFVCGSVALIFNLAKAYRKKKDGEEYAPTYKKMSKPGAIFEGADDTIDESASTETDNGEEKNEEAGDLLQKFIDEEAKSFEEDKNNGEDN